jgi:hypothetical protein
MLTEQNIYAVVGNLFNNTPASKRYDLAPTQPIRLQESPGSQLDLTINTQGLIKITEMILRCRKTMRKDAVKIAIALKPKFHENADGQHLYI